MKLSLENLAALDWKKDNGLLPAIIQDADDKKVLMLGYVNLESLQKTLSTKQVTFFSRSRKTLWTKGETSGNVLNFIQAYADCDQDTILIYAKPQGPTCHTGTRSCFEEAPEAGLPNVKSELSNKKTPASESLSFLSQLESIIHDRFTHPSENSYVAKLIKEGFDRIVQKVGEEAIETVIAAKNTNQNEFESEAADLLFHLMVLLQVKDSSLSRISAVLKERHR